ncbi:MAG: hypothetical protein A2235_11595 [Deltaproteobacteria bacterium RIFOXYA2_FULL_42_10]|nr:MAG: hypothetical protein A2090_05195 [Deltaproteobacteria bacterium GWD2_42_10]OGQ37119.1 MAG: hypothetical protein A3H47_08490 [Deltaproteobacteria bacterium RIFCSPLOWO2_02_FULL_42_39]OGQ73479.1 MAG: hypothetical protein A2235_11595 [Deltaproteobacteria bacterium RIFOXYA2_FULL_42_10]
MAVGSAVMDKVDLLRNLSNTNFFSLLTNGELKLYILLLVNAPEIGAVGEISLPQLEKVSGTIPSLSEIKTMMASLDKYGLAILEKVTAWPTGKLRFRLKAPVKGSIVAINKRYDRKMPQLKR